MNAFVDVIRTFGGNKYDFTLRETQTYEIIEDVRDCYQTITTLSFDGIGLDFIEGKQKVASLSEKDKLWINPPCGLKTRGITETDASLNNLVRATKILREQI